MNKNIVLFSIPSTKQKVLCRKDNDKYILFDGYGLEFYSINEDLFELLYYIHKNESKDSIVKKFCKKYKYESVEEIQKVIDIYIESIPLKTIDLSCI